MTITKSFLCILIGLLMFTTGCSQQETVKLGDKNKESSKNYSINEEIWNVSNKAVHLLKNKDMENLAEMIHPKKGVLFCEDAHIEQEEDQVFTKEKIVHFFEDKNNYTWGYCDGTGNPINLTPKEYYEKRIYDKDFINADQVGINVSIGKGNSIQNHDKIFQNGNFVEYHFKGFEKQYQGIDWESLRLVFEKYENKWYLVGIIHDHWTV